MTRRDLSSEKPETPHADAQGAGLPPLDPELAALLAAERVPPPVDPAIAARLFARVESSVAKVASAGGAEAAAGAKASLGAAKAMLVALLAAGGLMAILLTSGPEQAPTQPPPEPPLAAHIAEPEEAPPAIVEEADEAMDDAMVDAVEAEVEEPGDEAASPGPEAETDAPEVEPRQDDAPRTRPTPPAPAPPEYTLLKDARAALAAGDLKGARRHLNLHRRAYPRGVLGEESEVLEIRLARALGKEQRARDLLARFRARYPQSLHLPALEATVGEGR